MSKTSKTSTRKTSRKTKPPRTALCLSGGGFRAALFHMGACLRLYETGLLDEIDSVSCVSGGSIFGSFLAAVIRKEADFFTIKDPEARREKYEASVAAPFRRFVGRDMRTEILASNFRAIFKRPDTIAQAMIDYYDRHLLGSLNDDTQPIRLGELPERPAFIFCATDMVNAGPVAFSHESMRGPGIDRTSRKIPVAFAVAASSSFPPIFGPLRLHRKKLNLLRKNQELPEEEVLQLVDGGVYDNLGLQPFDSAVNYPYLLVSDAGAPFEPKLIGQNVFYRLARIPDLLMRQVGALRRKGLLIRNEYRKATKLPASKSEVHPVSYWAITNESKSMELLSVTETDPEMGYNDALALESIAKVRTDLDNFSDAEIRILTNHGYFMAHRGIQKAGLRFLTKTKDLAAVRAPHPEDLDASLVAQALKNSDQGFTSFLRRQSFAQVRRKSGLLLGGLFRRRPQPRALPDSRT